MDFYILILIVYIINFNVINDLISCFKKVLNINCYNFICFLIVSIIVFFLTNELPLKKHKKANEQANCENNNDDRDCENNKSMCL